jgi:stress-induced morphogen
MSIFGSGSYVDLWDGKMPVQTVDYDYAALAPKVKAALRRAFPENSTIVTSEGYGGRVHAKVVSERFNGISERQKQDILWNALRSELKEDAQAVSLALAYGPDEL